MVGWSRVVSSERWEAGWCVVGGGWRAGRRIEGLGIGGLRGRRVVRCGGQLEVGGGLGGLCRLGGERVGEWVGGGGWVAGGG